MPYIKVFIHFVWSTKNGEPFLNSLKLRKKMWNHIRDNSNKKNIHIDFISGHNDHCHCIVSMNAKQTMSDIMRALKGESSFWINHQNLIEKHFEWQNEYYAVSVSPSHLDRVRDYIKNQEEHHKDKSFNDECDEMVEKFGFVKYKDN